MALKDKYTNTKDKDKEENKDKTTLSDDAYAIVEYVEHLVNKIEQARMT